MDLYSRLFNLLEEPDMERRQFLKSSIAGAATLFASGSLLEKSHDFEEKLDDMYKGGFPGFEEDRPNALIDVIEIGDNYLQQEVIDMIEAVYDENGVNAIVKRRKQEYPEKKFYKHYGGDAAKILGTDGYNGFIEDQVSLPMRSSAIQAVVSPGKADDPEGWLEYDLGPEKMYRTGFATDSIALGSDNAFKEVYSDNFLRGKALVLMHEIGHSYGLEHIDDQSNVMYENVDLNADLEYTSEQWKKIRRSI